MNHSKLESHDYKCSNEFPDSTAIIFNVEKRNHQLCVIPRNEISYITERELLEMLATLRDLKRMFNHDLLPMSDCF